jgi:methyl-accepting chemotaxis protein
MLPLVVCLVAVYLSLSLPLIAAQKMGYLEEALFSLDDLDPDRLAGQFNGFAQLDKTLLEAESHIRRNKSGHKNMASEIGYSSAELSSTAQQLAANILQQSQATTNIAATVTQISHSIDEIAQRMEGIYESSSVNSSRCEEGLGVISSVIGNMDEVSSFIDTTKRQISALNDKVSNISSISNVIRDISEQTNLLALNAAIEAARAGEHGRGFAVVAEEVRALATRSYSSVKMISDNIDEVQQNMDAVMEGMDHVVNKTVVSSAAAKSAGDVFEVIATNTQSVTDGMSAISEASQQQKHAAVEISQSIEEIAVVARENGGKAEQASSIAQHLHELCRSEEESS